MRKLSHRAGSQSRAAALAVRCVPVHEFEPSSLVEQEITEKKKKADIAAMRMSLQSVNTQKDGSSPSKSSLNAASHKPGS